jgi:hypothetical protein
MEEGRKNGFEFKFEPEDGEAALKRDHLIKVSSFSRRPFLMRMIRSVLAATS